MSQAIKGKLVQERFLIGEPLESGKFGSVFKVQDIQTKKDYVIKLSPQYELLAYEIKILKKITKKLGKSQHEFYLPQILEYGMVLLHNMD